jgi:hypothetical protein
MSKLTIRCREFRPWNSGTLRGFAILYIEEMRLAIRGVAVHEKNAARWAQLPARPQVKDDALVKRADGKLEYTPVLEFSDKQTRDAFSAAAIRAVLEHASRAFEAPARQGDLTPGYPSNYPPRGQVSNKPATVKPTFAEELNDEIPW